MTPNRVRRSDVCLLALTATVVALPVRHEHLLVRMSGSIARLTHRAIVHNAPVHKIGLASMSIAASAFARLVKPVHHFLVLFHFFPTIRTLACVHVVFCGRLFQPVVRIAVMVSVHCGRYGQHQHDNQFFRFHKKLFFSKLSGFTFPRDLSTVLRFVCK